MKLTPAARIQVIQELLAPRPIYNEDGEKIGEDPPLLVLTSEQYVELLKL